MAVDTAKTRSAMLGQPRAVGLLTGSGVLLVAVGIGYLLVGQLRDGIQAQPVLLAALLILAGLLSVMGAALFIRQAARMRAFSTELKISLSTQFSSASSASGGEFSELRDAVRVLQQEYAAFREDKLEVLASNRVLNRNLRRVFQLLDASDEGMILMASSGEIFFANAAASPFLSVSPEAACGKSARDCLTHPELVELLDAEETESSFCGVRSREIQGEGDRVVEAVVVFAMENGMEAFGHLLTFRDMSRLKDIESVQTDFVDAVAHELRTPLTSIRAYVEMLVDGDAEDEQAKLNFYNIIYEETHRLSDLIDNMLSLSQLESGRAEPDIAPIRLKRLLEDSINVIRPQCASKQIVLSSDLPDRLPTVNVDKRLLGIALMNILGNAVKYTPEGGTIEVSTASLTDEFQVLVRDSGIGISEEDVDRVFEKFYRASAAEAMHGSGVGLACAQQAVHLHGGTIRVTSKVGEGSLFLIALPRAIINTSIGD